MQPQAALSLLFEFTRAEGAEDPYAFRAGPQVYILRGEGGGAETATLDWDAGLLADLTATQRPGVDPAVTQRLGDRMRAFLNQTGWTRYEQRILQAVAEGRPIGLTFRSNAAELYSLPWELLTLRSTGQALGELPGLLLRQAWPETTTHPEEPMPRGEGGRILFAWAGQVPAAEHERAIRAACERGNHPFDASRDVLPNASPERLLRRLRDSEAGPVAVLHLLCHGLRGGETYGLALERDDGGGSQLVDATWLRRNLAEHAGHLRLVVLCACDSANSGQLGNHLGSVAQAVHQAGVAAVVASRFPLTIPGSVVLADSLYEQLVVRLASLEDAVRRTRRRLSERTGSLDWASMQLYARPEDDDRDSGVADSRPLIFRPYRGLLAFQAEHQRFFFGRDREIDELVGELEALRVSNMPRFLVVAGASGTGKSSLVLAGAVPRLMAPPLSFRMIYLRPGSEPEKTLAAELSAPMLVTSDRPLLLCVDQFEELFTHTTDAEARSRFVQRLWQLASAAGGNISVIITLRVDFIGRCGELLLDNQGTRLDRVAYDEAHRVFVAQMSPEQLQTAIERPAHEVGLTLQAGLAQRMVQEVGGELGTLPLMQDTLDMLWQKRQGRLLTQAAYAELGGVSGALHGRADKLLASMSAEEQRTARRLLESLGTLGEDETQLSRRRVKKEELVSRDPEEARRLESVLAKLISERLLVSNIDRNQQEIEVAHEALLRGWPQLRQWIQEDRKMLIELGDLRDWVAQWSRHQLLLTGTQLGYAEEMERRYPYDIWPEARRLIADSRAELTRKRKKERFWGLSLLVFFVSSTVLFGVMGGLSLRSRNAARESSQEAEAATKTAQREREQTRIEAMQARDALRIGAARELAQDPARAAAILREIETEDLSKLRVFLPIVVGALYQRAWMVAESPEFKFASQAAALSPSGRQVAIASARQIHVLSLDKNDRRQPLVLRGHTKTVTSVDWSPDGGRVLTSSRDGTARVWLTDDSGESTVLSGHGAPIISARFSSDGQRVITAALDHTARIWSADGTGQPLELVGHQEAVQSAAWSPDGKFVVTVTVGGTLRRFGSEGRGRALPLLLKTKAEPALSVTFSPDGKTLAVTHQNGTVELLASDGRGPVLTLRGHSDEVLSAAFSPDGTQLATTSRDGTARVWRTDGLGTPIVLSGHRNAVVSARFSSDGQQLVTASADQHVRTWQLSGPLMPQILFGHRGEVTSAAWSPEGARVITGSTDRTARIFYLGQPGRPPLVLGGHEDALSSVAFSPDGQEVLTATRAGKVRIFASDGRDLRRPQVLYSGSPVHAVAFSPDGQQVALACDDQLIRLLRRDGKGPPVELRGHEEAVLALTYSPDGTHLVSGGADQSVRLMPIPGRSSDAARVFNMHSDEVLAVAFGDDNQHILSGSADKTARLFDGSGANVYTIIGHRAGVSAVTIRPGGGSMATGSLDRTVRLWRQGETPLILSGHQGGITALAYSPDGRHLLSAAKDGTAWIWEINIDVAAMARKLWLATPYCPPPEMRKNIFNATEEEAARMEPICQDMVRCLRDSPGDEAAGAETFARCWRQFHQRQAELHR